MQSHPSTPADRSIPHFLVATSLDFHRSRDRLPLLCPIIFAGVPFIGEGFLHNISPGGCTVECARSVLQGSYMKLRLLLPDQPPSLAIDLAAVRWVQKPYFGLEFLRLTGDQQVRLDEFLAHHLRR
jgi:hypothetical protein